MEFLGLKAKIFGIKIQNIEIPIFDKNWYFNIVCLSGFLEIHDLVSSERWMRRNGMQEKKS